MRSQQRGSAVGEAAGQTAQQVDLPINLLQQQRTTVGRRLTSREPSIYTARKMSCKGEGFSVTLCHQKGRLLFEAFSYVWITQLCHENSGLLSLSFSFSLYDIYFLPTAREKCGLGRT